MTNQFYLKIKYRKLKHVRIGHNQTKIPETKENKIIKQETLIDIKKHVNCK